MDHIDPCIIEYFFKYEVFAFYLLINNHTESLFINDPLDPLDKNTDEWYIEWQRVTANDNEWQRVVQRVTMNDHSSVSL